VADAGVAGVGGVGVRLGLLGWKSGGGDGGWGEGGLENEEEGTKELCWDWG
jgi:hypothetical protein